jgi:hypothetical protein
VAVNRISASSLACPHKPDAAQPRNSSAPGRVSRGKTGCRVARNRHPPDRMPQAGPLHVTRSKCESRVSKTAYVFSNDPTGANPWNPDWATHKASEQQQRLASSSISKGYVITRLASCSRLDSTCAILPRALATAVAGLLHCGIMPTLCLRSIAARRPTWPN